MGKKTRQPPEVKDLYEERLRRLQRRAEQEGRLGGAHQCPTCGMSHHTQEDAAECCYEIRKHEEPNPRGFPRRKKPKE